MRRLARTVLALALVAGCAGRDTVTPRVGPVVVTQAPDDGPGAGYVGSGTCRPCHERAYEFWQRTGHAAEFAGLLPADRRRSECLRCHVTGYGNRSGYVAAAPQPDLAAVGCEACHGAGADHARSAQPSLVPTATGGACPPCEVNRICRLCHTPERSSGFDLAAALDQVACPRSRGR